MSHFVKSLRVMKHVKTSFCISSQLHSGIGKLLEASFCRALESRVRRLRSLPDGWTVLDGWLLIDVYRLLSRWRDCLKHTPEQCPSHYIVVRNFNDLLSLVDNLDTFSSKLFCFVYFSRVNAGNRLLQFTSFTSSLWRLQPSSWSRECCISLFLRQIPQNSLVQLCVQFQ